MWKYIKKAIRSMVPTTGRRLVVTFKLRIFKNSQMVFWTEGWIPEMSESLYHAQNVNNPV